VTVENGIIREIFNRPGDFVAISDAIKWCADRGVSCGSMQRDEPIGLIVGNFNISKWRNLSNRDRKELHGTITGDKRNGPVTVSILENALAKSSQP
jgi:hypothetical protein